MVTKYDVIGIRYNETRQADDYIAGRLAFHLLPEKGKTYLDIGCGTGNYTAALAVKGYRFIGIDPSKIMLEEAKDRHPHIRWQQGDGAETGLSDQSLDGIMAVLTIHHWPDIERSFLELNRILKPGGRFVIFTSTPQQMEQYWLNHYFPHLMRKSIEQMPRIDSINRALVQAGFTLLITETYAIRPGLKDLFLQSGKYHPEIYFRPDVRRGISTFAALGDPDEIKTGLAKLKADIDDGQIDRIIASYESDLRDYLFMIAHKSTD